MQSGLGAHHVQAVNHGQAVPGWDLRRPDVELIVGVVDVVNKTPAPPPARC